MATEHKVGMSLARSELNKKELATFEAVLRSVAPLIDALMVDGVPYTKLITPPPEVSNVSTTRRVYGP